MTVPAGVPVVEVDLTEESLSLAVCGLCWALTRQADFPAHQQWHVWQRLEAANP